MSENISIAMGVVGLFLLGGLVLGVALCLTNLNRIGDELERMNDFLEKINKP